MISVCKKYCFLMKQLIIRDFKVKYKRSSLGILWSLLYPVLTMSVMALVFTNFFKMTLPGVNYLVYLISGLVIFNYYSEATNLAMSSVVANFINFALSLVPMYAIIILTGTPLSLLHLLLPLIYVLLFIFSVGMGFMLSTVSVFLRDMFYIYGVFLTLLQYLTPIVYDISYIPQRFALLLRLNPLYWYVTASRTIILYGVLPDLTSWLFCAAFAALFLSLGIYVFRRSQNKFIYYV